MVELARQGWRIVVVHGNGPQVGDSLVRNELARRIVEPLPLGMLVAETAGWIGYMLQQSLQNALAAARVRRDVATLITQTLVDRYDPALATPTKPIGQPLTDAEADAAARGGTLGGPGRGGALAPHDGEPAAPRRGRIAGGPAAARAGDHRHRGRRRRAAGLR